MVPKWVVVNLEQIAAEAKAAEIHAKEGNIEPMVEHLRNVKLMSDHVKDLVTANYTVAASRQNGLKLETVAMIQTIHEGDFSWRDC